jgi:hypothetical protein
MPADPMTVVVVAALIPLVVAPFAIIAAEIRRERRRGRRRSGRKTHHAG